MDMADTFRDEGYEVFESADGTDAMNLFAGRHSEIDVLVTDIRLGNGPDGWDLARFVRERRDDLPIVFVSGDSVDDWEPQGILASIMLAKPVPCKDLIEAVRASLSN